MRPQLATQRAGVPVASVRPDDQIKEFRRRRAELEKKNREIALVGMQEGRSLTLPERRAIEANLHEIRSIKATLRAFGALYE